MDREAAALLEHGPGETEVFHPAPGARYRHDPAAEKAFVPAVLTPQEAEEVRRRSSPRAAAVQDAWQAAVGSLLEKHSISRYNAAVEAFRRRP